MVGTPKDQERAARTLAASDDAVPFLLAQLPTHMRAALALLARACKREPARKQAAAHVAQLTTYLANDDAKVRKNAAVLLGALGEAAAVPALVQALEREGQQFVRPSLILALGALGGKQARQAIQTLPEPQGAHAQAESEAIQKALSRLAPQKALHFTGLTQPTPVLLVPVSGLFDSLADEAAQLGITLDKQGTYARTQCADLDTLFAMRCFQEALLPIASDIAYTPEAVYGAVQPFYQALCAMHSGSTFATRLELRNAKGINRRSFASRFFALADAEQFHNSPSSYDIEIRVVGSGNRVQVYGKLHTYTDERFAYRQGSVAASIHPAAAAAALRCHHKLLQPSARVLDPFCGSGTMLVERHMLGETAALHGVDISRPACAIARRNAKTARIAAMPVYNRDIVGFQADEPYDEIISNMPFGNRVGNHSDNEVLYRKFVMQANSLLRDGGLMLLITTEKKLLKQCVRQNSSLHIADETSFSYGGLNPSLFLIRK